MRWLQTLRGNSGRSRPADISDALWQDTLDRFPFLARFGKHTLPALRRLTRDFLDHKVFTAPPTCRSPMPWRWQLRPRPACRY